MVLPPRCTRPDAQVCVGERALPRADFHGVRQVSSTQKKTWSAQPSTRTSVGGSLLKHVDGDWAPSSSFGTADALNRSFGHSRWLTRSSLPEVERDRLPGVSELVAVWRTAAIWEDVLPRCRLGHLHVNKVAGRCPVMAGRARYFHGASQGLDRVCCAR